MTSTVFIDKQTTIVAAWLNDVNTSTYGVDTVAALKALTYHPPIIYRRGYWAANDGCNGFYYPDVADTTSSDNAGTILVATDGMRWKWVQSQTWTVKTFGATGNGATDSASMTRETAAINAALTYAASLSSQWPIWVGLPAQNNETYVVNGQIQISSDSNVGLEGLGGNARIKYAGSLLGASGATGAIVYFTGYDHSFGGLRRVQIDANVLAYHCVYMEGIVNSGFDVQFVHYKNAVSHGIWVNYNVAASGKGPVNASWHHLTSYPAVANFNGTGKNAVCGGYPFYLTPNVTNGSFALRDSGYDNGALGVIGFGDGASTYSDCQLVLDHVRFEMNDSVDCLTASYKDAVAAGQIVLDACEYIDVPGGLVCNLIKVNNNTATPARPPIEIYSQRFSSPLNAAAFIYKETADTTYNYAFNGVDALAAHILCGATADLVTPNYAATITPVLGRGQETTYVIGTLTGNITINAISTLCANKRLTFRFKQDGTGGRTITWNGQFVKAADGAGSANKVGSVSFICDGTSMVQNGGALAFN